MSMEDFEVFEGSMGDLPDFLRAILGGLKPSNENILPHLAEDLPDDFLELVTGNRVGLDLEPALSEQATKRIIAEGMLAEMEKRAVKLQRALGSVSMLAEKKLARQAEQNQSLRDDMDRLRSNWQVEEGNYKRRIESLTHYQSAAVNINNLSDNLQAELAKDQPDMEMVKDLTQRINDLVHDANNMAEWVLQGGYEFRGDPPVSSSALREQERQAAEENTEPTATGEAATKTATAETETPETNETADDNTEGKTSKTRIVESSDDDNTDGKSKKTKEKKKAA